MKRKFLIFSLILTLICIAGIIVFSCVEIPEKGAELAMAIFGLVMVIDWLVFMLIYIRERKRRKKGL